jgi:hypothetical protein
MGVKNFSITKNLRNHGRHSLTERNKQSQNPPRMFAPGQICEISMRVWENAQPDRLTPKNWRDV